MSMTQVLAIPRNHPIFQWFRYKRILIPETEIPYTPEELIGSATIRPKQGLLTDSAFFQLWLSVVLIKSGFICTFWDNTKKPCHLWIGGNILQNWLQYKRSLMKKSLQETLDRYMDIAFSNPIFLGFICKQQDLSQNAFGILYCLHVDHVQFRNEAVTVKWLRISEIKKKYRKLDHWSKRIFDYIYETTEIRERFGLYQKKRFPSKKTS